MAFLGAAGRRERGLHYGHDAEQITFTVIGAKTGEKNHEQLMSEEESSRAHVSGAFCVIAPPFLKTGAQGTLSGEKPLTLRSDAGPFLSVDEIAAKLVQWGLIKEWK